MDTCEELVNLYLRLNGFFTLTDYLLHSPGGQQTDVDVLGVRFPFKREMFAGKLLEDDPSLELSGTKTDVVLGEVGRTRSDFNLSWRNVQRMRYVVDFLGFFDREEESRDASDKLAAVEPFENDAVRIRPVLFTGKPDVEPGLIHRPLDEVLRFVEDRFRENRRLKVDQRQWADKFSGLLFRLVCQGQRLSIDDLDRRIIARFELRDDTGGRQATAPRN